MDQFWQISVLLQFLKLSKPVCSYLRTYSGSWIVSILTGVAILNFGFVDFELYSVAILMTLTNKNKKKKGLVATLSRKAAEKLQLTFWQNAGTKAVPATPRSPSISEESVAMNALGSSVCDEDSFVTSRTHLNVSIPSSLSSSYMTASDETATDKVLKIMPAIGTDVPAIGISSAIGDINEPVLSGRQKSFDTDSGNGGSPPPSQHVDNELREIDTNNGKTNATPRPSRSRFDSFKNTNGELRKVKIILEELQSDTISDEIKANGMAYLNHIILQTDNYLQRCFIRKDLMSMGLLDALSGLVESRNQSLEMELNKFFISDSDDNLIGNGTRDPIDVFHAAYLKMRRTKNADILLDLLELITRIQPSGKRLRCALQVLKRGHLRSAGVQTEGAGKLSTIQPLPSSANELMHSKDTGNFSAPQDSLALIGSSPMLQIIRRPRSVSRMRQSSTQRKIDMNDIPFIDDDNFTTSPDKNLDEASEGKCDNLQKSAESQRSARSHESKSPRKPIAAAALLQQQPPPPPPPPLLPPPPPPPPPPEYLNPSMVCRKLVTESSPVVVKAVPVYRKQCATNTVIWETVKPEIIVAKSTIWSDQSGANDQFHYQERERLEKVFERVQGCNLRLNATQKGIRDGGDCTKETTGAFYGLMEKRALNLSIILAKFRPLTLKQLVEKIGSQEISELSHDYLASLLKHFPTPDELTYFAKLTNGDQLKDAELFCYFAARTPYLKLHIELKVLADNIANDLSRQLDCTRILLNATDELYNSTSIKAFFHRCLQYGNFLNQSTFAAGASGFALSSLLLALNTKGNGKAANTRLVDVLAEYADDKLRNVVTILDVLERVKKTSIDDLEESELLLRRSLEMSLKSLQDCDNRELYEHYSTIVMDSITKCGQLSRNIKKVRHNENRLKEYYCCTTMTLKNILDILYQAIALFQDALKKAESHVGRTEKSSQQRVSAGQDNENLRNGMRRRRNYHSETLKKPNISDLIDIITLNECH